MSWRGPPRSERVLPAFNEDSDFYVSPSNVVVGPVIGSGQFSRVYLAKYFGDYVAVKKQTRDAEELETYLLRELAVLSFVRHGNMLEYIGAYNEAEPARGGLSNAVFIITELAEGGDLLRLLLSVHPLGWSFRTRIAAEVAAGLTYLVRVAASPRARARRAPRATTRATRHDAG